MLNEALRVACHRQKIKLLPRHAARRHPRRGARRCPPRGCHHGRVRTTPGSSPRLTRGFAVAQRGRMLTGRWGRGRGPGAGLLARSARSQPSASGATGKAKAASAPETYAGPEPSRQRLDGRPAEVTTVTRRQVVVGAGIPRPASREKQGAGLASMHWNRRGNEAVLTHLLSPRCARPCAGPSRARFGRFAALIPGHIYAAAVSRGGAEVDRRPTRCSLAARSVHSSNRKPLPSRRNSFALGSQAAPAPAYAQVSAPAPTMPAADAAAIGVEEPRSSRSRRRI
jgi:hypothetical protein